MAGCRGSALFRLYEKAKREMDQGNENEMIVFYNTRLARCWARQKEQAKYDELMARAEDYLLGTVPAKALGAHRRHRHPE